ncbi:MAG: hypothetical protein IJS21_03140, partial [Deltaproteobacteria bacterium]|nr:hypothetical protein [Deltaproteobacteria bacterium]
LRLKHADTFSGFSPIFVKKIHTFIPCSNSQFLMVKRAKLIFNRHFPLYGMKHDCWRKVRNAPKRVLCSTTEKCL